MRAKVPQAQTVDQGFLDQGSGRFGQKHLSAMARLFDAGPAYDV